MAIGSRFGGNHHGRHRSLIDRLLLSTGVVLLCSFLYTLVLLRDWHNETLHHQVATNLTDVLEATFEMQATPSQHPDFRIAVVIPWVGDTFPVWMDYFIESCRSNSFLIDWLVFHEGVELPANTADNVIFIDTGKEGIAR